MTTEPTLDVARHRLVTSESVRAGRGGWARVMARVLVGAVLLLGAAFAQEVCADRLRRAVSEDDPPVRVATSLMRTALSSVEPALPTDRGTSREWEDENAEWLQRRGYLPNDWDEDAELTQDMWGRLLANLQTPYRVEPRPLSGGTDPDALLDDTARAVAAVADAVRPLALIATDPQDRQTVAFAGVIWNWSPWPRLLVFDPSELRFGEDGDVEPVLQGLGTCAWRPQAYLTTNADRAASYYTGNADATMELLATDHGADRHTVPEERERDVLGFRYEPLEGARVASLGFEGAGPSVGQVAQLIANVRTNLGMFDMGHFLAFP